MYFAGFQLLQYNYKALIVTKSHLQPYTSHQTTRQAITQSIKQSIK